MIAAVEAVLALIEQLLPLITGASNAAMINGILTVLERFLPIIVTEVAALYQPVKNIIDALSANPATNAEQLAKLQAVDKAVDAAFDAAAADTDNGV